MRLIVMISLVLGLAACGDWPNVPGTAGNRSEGWPALAPLSDVERGLATVPGAPEEEATRLAARADALRRRAAILRAPVPDQDAFEALRARLRR